MASIAMSTPEVVSDLRIEQWVHQQYGFVPHPFWINHCRQLYGAGAPLSEAHCRPWHECPADKRSAIKEAFLHFGILEA
jgi:hypothetical protein